MEKFKLEGGPYRKSSAPPPDLEHLEHKVPLSAYGRPDVFSTMMALLGWVFRGRGRERGRHWEVMIIVQHKYDDDVMSL